MTDEGPGARKLREATRQFEAFFVGHLLKEMRKTTGDGGFLAPSEGEKIFREMMDDETARVMSTTGQVGIADLMYRELLPSIEAAKGGAAGQGEPAAATKDNKGAKE